MDVKRISPFLSVSPQIYPAHMEKIAALGFKTIINNRPDKEADDQPLAQELSAEAAKNGVVFINQPVIPGHVTRQDAENFATELKQVQGPVLAFCRTGTRCTMLWAMSEARHMDADVILNFAASMGYDLKAHRATFKYIGELAAGDADAQRPQQTTDTYDVIIVGGGSAGIATAASLLKRRPGLDIVVIEPRYKHFYQPGFTMVGGGIFEPAQPQVLTEDVMPAGVRWVRTAAAGFEPRHNQVILEDGTRIGYRQLVVASGLKLHWGAVEGLRESLGKNGVTSNYRFDYAPYTWELVQNLRSGRAIFTKPPMPIKCPGAPQKAMYLSCDHWLRNQRLADIEVKFCSANAALFDVEHFVPALMQYVQKYDANLDFFHNLVAVDGPAQKAWFDIGEPGKEARREEIDFDMIHVVPPQIAPGFVRSSPLVNEEGWVDVSRDTLRHTRFENVFSLGDVCSAPNAKTLAAARRQAPVVAENLIAVLEGREPVAYYDGYGSCPLTVEKGKIVLAEYGYEKKLLPTFPQWLIKSDEASKVAWFLKEKMLPSVYFKLMLKGREWLAKPQTHVK